MEQWTPEVARDIQDKSESLIWTITEHQGLEVLQAVPLKITSDAK